MSESAAFRSAGTVPGIPVWEEIKGKGETLYRVATSSGLEVTLSSLGANLRSVKWQGREITEGYADPSVYSANPAFLGATVGRFANRIAAGKATVGGKTLSLARNNGANHLHGGPTGYQVRPFRALEIRGSLGFAGKEYPARGVAFDLVSPDGDEGYPGTLTLRVSVLVATGGLLALHYHAVTDKTTLCNLTNHAYWNLQGEGTTIHDQVLAMHCSAWMDAVEGIPTGTFVPQEGSRYDFSSPSRLGNFLDPARDEVMVEGGKGVDHCFVVSPDAEVSPATLYFEDAAGKDFQARTKVRKGATLSGGGITMDVWTSLPGIQVYTQNFGDGSAARTGKVLSYRAICLETQLFPDCPNQAEGYRAWGEAHGHDPADMQKWDARLEPGSVWDELTIHQWR